MQKRVILIIIYFIFTGCAVTSLIARDNGNSKITILDQKSLIFLDKNGIPFEGVSDLTYNRRKHRLYMIGDRGYLYSFYIKFGDKIEILKYLNAFHIRTLKGKILHPDIEGLTHNSKGELIASFERYPRVKKISRDGRLILNYKIPKKLKNKRVYRNRNSIFEAVAYHPKYGILIASEYPINRAKKINQTIYSLNGKEWHFKAQPYHNSAVTALEVMSDGNILVLERAYRGLTYPIYITLKKVYLDRCDIYRNCKSEVLEVFDSDNGGGYNNFEGLARVGKDRYLMVSDNNGHFFLSTILIYFKVNDI